MGSARFIAPKTVEVALTMDGTRVGCAAKIVIVSTGTRATIEAIPGLVESKPLTHIEALELDHVPQHLIVLGGGYIGLEFAQAMRRFGSSVTIIDRNERLMSREDDDVCDALRSLLQMRASILVMNARVKRVAGISGQSVKLYRQQDGAETLIEGTHLLVAAGRTPNTDGIGWISPASSLPGGDT